MIGHINSAASIWLQWMGHMFWQVGLLIILAMLIDMAIRRRAWPHIRYVLWGMVFLKLLIPPAWHMPTGIVSLIQPKVSANIPAQIEQNGFFDAATPASEKTEPGQNQDSESASAEKATWQIALFLIWIGGMLFFALVLAVQLSRFPKRSQRRYSRNAPEWFNDVLNNACGRMRLKKAPAVIFSGKTKSPAVYGLFRPTLVLPGEYFADLTREQAEHVLLHELCHVKRGDLWVHWFCIVLQIVYWFNPLLILARRQMRHISEICCDLSVAYVLKEKTAAYRETLLSTSRKLLSDTVEPGIGLLGIFEEPFKIVARLKWLEQKTWEHRKRKITATMVTILIMVGFVMPMAGNSQPSEENGEIPLQSDADVPSTGNAEVYDINMVDTDIIDAIKFISEITGKTFVIDSSVKGKINVVSKRLIPEDQLYSAFETIMEIHGFALVPSGDIIKVVPATTSSSKIEMNTGQVGANPPQSNADAPSTGNAETCTINMVNADISALIETISVLTGKAFIVDSSVQGKVNVASPANISVEEAYQLFESVLAENGFTLVPVGKAIRIVSVSGKSPSPSTSASRIRLRRTQVDSAMENLTELMQHITFTPYSEEGVEGFVMSDIKANSIFRRMGLRNGDILVALEGQPFTNGEQTQQFIESLKSSDTFILEIIRRDKSRRYEYVIE